MRSNISVGSKLTEKEKIHVFKKYTLPVINKTSHRDVKFSTGSIVDNILITIYDVCHIYITIFICWMRTRLTRVITS